MNPRKRTLERKRGSLAMEQKYQFIKGWAMFVSSDEQAYRSVRVGSFHEYMNDKDAGDIIGIKNAFENAQRFFAPQGTAQKQYLNHFGREAKAEGMTATRTDKIASFVLQMKQGLRIKRLPWHRRDLGRPRAEPRFGSSIGVIGRTKVSGADVVYEKMEQLATALNDMFLRIGKYPNITVKINTSRGVETIGGKK